MAFGKRLKGAVPRLERIDADRRAERARLPRKRHNLQSFWTDYLLGRDRKVGIELMTATAAYKNFMEQQVRLLRLSDGERVADLGSGTGDFVVSVASQPDPPRGLQVDQVDYVAAALERSTDRLARMDVDDRVSVRAIVADLNLRERLRGELGDARYDAVLSSLVISYLSDPGAFLQEAHRMLKPGGRLVLSTLKRDADISRIFLDGMAELAPSPERHELGEDVARSFDELARSFFNDASKILDFEEDGTFRFWDDHELLEAVRAAGFVDAQSRPGLGDPPQAVIVSAVKP
jgi:ubiquinone/menaquinone biosynthesis C-methylase UbiE